MYYLHVGGNELHSYLQQVKVHALSDLWVATSPMYTPQSGLMVLIRPKAEVCS